ncbi:MAG TPA: hypothetical protein VEL07_19860 [Planctomycetota bacterium]|nr:hypothetical protein [Planctomycetota bacterium]
MSSCQPPRFTAGSIELNRGAVALLRQCLPMAAWRIEPWDRHCADQLLADPAFALPALPTCPADGQAPIEAVCAHAKAMEEWKRTPVIVAMSDKQWAAARRSVSYFHAAGAMPKSAHGALLLSRLGLA